MLAHDALDVLGCFACVVEGDCRDEMMADVRADDVVEEVGVDESEITIDCCGCATGECPCLVVVVRHCCVGVLEESDGHYISQ